MRIFWESHSASRSAWSRQYRSAVFWHDEEQRRAAIAMRNRLTEERGARVYTEIERAGVFTPAEDYHQKYILRRNPALFAEIAAVYPETDALVASTAAARLNGYVGGNGLEHLRADIEQLGLSPAARARLLELTAR